MKEIKVKIVSQCETSDGLYKIEVKPLETIYCPLNWGKTYKLVEDESKYIDTDSLYKTTIKTLLNGVYGGIHLLTELTPVKFPDSELVKGYCENDVKQISKLKTSTTYGVFEKARVQFNGNATILEIGDFKTVVKCHEDDEFVPLVGLGIALSRYYKKQPDTKKEIKYLKECEDIVYPRLADYCVNKYFNYDTKRIKSVIFAERGKWIEL